MFYNYSNKYLFCYVSIFLMIILLNKLVNSSYTKYYSSIEDFYIFDKLLREELLINLFIYYLSISSFFSIKIFIIFYINY